MRVLIVDDQDFIRRGLRALLIEDKDIEVCGEAADGLQAIEKVQELRPDVVIMDISLPGLDGLQATREIRRTFSGTQVITLSQYEIPDVVKEARRAGAITHVPKALLWARLIPALKSLAATDSRSERVGPIRVLIADDHDVVRKGVRVILSSNNIEVCGEACADQRGQANRSPWVRQQESHQPSTFESGRRCGSTERDLLPGLDRN